MRGSTKPYWPGAPPLLATLLAILNAGAFQKQAKLQQLYEKSPIAISRKGAFSGGGVLNSQPCSVLGDAGEPWKTLVKFTNSLIGGEHRSSLAYFARYVRRVVGCKSAESCDAEQRNPTQPFDQKWAINRSSRVGPGG
jgi:hypothetical protein